MSDMLNPGPVPLAVDQVDADALNQNYSLINRSQQVYAQERNAKKAPLNRKPVRTPDASTNQGA